MPNIKVDPAVLNSSAASVKNSAGGITNAGNNANSAASSAPSYDGQFGPKVKAIGNEARSIATGNSEKLINHGNKLIERAGAFQAADTYTITKNKWTSLRPVNPSIPWSTGSTIWDKILRNLEKTPFGDLIRKFEEKLYADKIAAEKAALEKAALEKAELERQSKDLRYKLTKTNILLKSQAVYEFIESNKSSTTTDVLQHGMTDSEKMYSITLEGLVFYFASNKDSNSAISKIVLDYFNSEKLPEELTRYTKEIVVTSQRNKADDYWAKAYNMPGFVSGATGDNGSIVIYKNYIAKMDTISHEMGHNLAVGKYGDHGNIKADSDYMKAINSGEAPPTKYATKANAEDFAESVSLYVENSEKFGKQCPERFKVIDKLLKDQDYAG